ncbi:MAG: tetratricopeptide repeat protein [Proteobacteria bacterium]|nr:tetratricopeptide repeat protein [Pseudomonadota bacterium]
MLVSVKPMTTESPISPQADHPREGDPKAQAQACLQASRFEEARQLYEQICRLNPQDAEAWFFFGAVNGQLGRFDEAITCSLRVIALQPDHSDARYNLAQAYMHQARFREAAEAYREVARRNPQHVPTLNNLGYALVQIGRFDEAVACHRQALRLQPNDAEALNNLGNALQGQGKKEEAVAAYREALRLRPEYASPRFQLAAMGRDETPPQAPPDYVRNLFDNYAERFDKHLVEGLEYRTPELLNRLVRKVLGNESRKLDILDLGCGTGLCGPMFRDLAHKLVGVDLSPKMIEKARARNLYDELLVGEITVSLMKPDTTFDLIIAADVFPYIGDLQHIFETCERTLKPDGLFAFSAEVANDVAGYVLRPTGRYAHSEKYVKNLSAKNGFSELVFEQTILRKDRGKPVHGYVSVFRHAHGPKIAA